MSNNDGRYRDAANSWLNESQQPRRYKVVKKGKANKALVNTLGAVGVAVAVFLMVYLGVMTDEKEFQARNQYIQNYIAENHINEYEPSAEEKAAALKAYSEDFYSADSIKSITASILNDYDVLIDTIINNGTKTDKNAVKVDDNKLAETIKDYVVFKEECQQNKTDYTQANDETRINQAYKLYGIDLNILEQQNKELETKLQKCAKGSAEYDTIVADMKTVSNRINNLKESITYTGEAFLNVGSNQK